MPVESLFTPVCSVSERMINNDLYSVRYEAIKFAKNNCFTLFQRKSRMSPPVILCSIPNHSILLW